MHCILSFDGRSCSSCACAAAICYEQGHSGICMKFHSCFHAISYKSSKQFVVTLLGSSSVVEMAFVSLFPLNISVFWHPSWVMGQGSRCGSEKWFVVSSLSNGYLFQVLIQGFHSCRDSIAQSLDDFLKCLDANLMIDAVCVCMFKFVFICLQQTIRRYLPRWWRQPRWCWDGSLPRYGEVQCHVLPYVCRKYGIVRRQSAQGSKQISLKFDEHHFWMWDTRSCRVLGYRVIWKLTCRSNMEVQGVLGACSCVPVIDDESRRKCQ